MEWDIFTHISGFTKKLKEHNDTSKKDERYQRFKEQADRMREKYDSYNGTLNIKIQDGCYSSECYMAPSSPKNPYPSYECIDLFDFIRKYNSQNPNKELVNYHFTSEWKGSIFCNASFLKRKRIK
jgi:hypothetical protein